MIRAHRSVVCHLAEPSPAITMGILAEQSPASTMGILMVSSSRACGGLEIYASRLACALHRRGHRVLFACRAGGWLGASVSKEGVPTLSIAPRNSGDPASALKMAIAIRRHGLTIIHAHKAKDHIPVLVAGRLGGAAVVFTRHDMMQMSSYSLRATASADRIVAVSDSVRHRQIELGLPPDRIVKLLAGVDTSRFCPRAGPRQLLPELGVPPDSPVLGIVARLSSEKGVDAFLRAVALLQPGGPQTRCLVVGDGPDRAQLEALSRELRLEGRVKFVGARDDVPRLLSELDVLILSSQREAFGLVVLEAMACGIPVIAPDAGGPAELVVPGVNGLLVPPGDTPALARAMSDLLDDPDRARAMGEAGRRQAVSFFTMDRMMQQMEMIYRSTLQARRAAILPAGS